MISKTFSGALASATLFLALGGCATSLAPPVPDAKWVTAPAPAAAPVTSPAPAEAQKRLATALPDIKPGEMPAADATPAQISQILIVWVAGYCQGWADVTGGGFERCFKLTTEETIKKYKENTGVDLTHQAAEAINK